MRNAWPAGPNVEKADLLARAVGPCCPHHDNRIINDKLLKSHQPEDIKGRYHFPIACLVDGTVVTIDTARTISLTLRATFNNKMHTQGALGIAWTSACGLLLRSTSMFCGRAGEEALVWLHRRMLDEFPKNFARLVDRGFTHCTGAYKNFLRAFHPAKVRNGRIGVEGVRDSRKQSADRYVVEVFFSRVKMFSMLKDRAPWAVIKFLDDVWHMALAATDLNGHLRAPHDLQKVEKKLQESAEKLQCEVQEALRQWPNDWEHPSYLQCE